MRVTLALGATLLILGSCIAMGSPSISPPGSRRTELQRHDLTVPGREVIQVRVDLDPGAIFPRHRHPGEEVIFVLKGTIQYQVQGLPTKTYRAGDVLMIPARAIHSARNVGSGEAAELATYIVEREKPLVELVK